MRTIGIWLPIDFRGHWKGEGIARIVKYALEGATRLPEAQNLQFRLYTSAWAEPEVRADMASFGNALESGQIAIIPFTQSRWAWRFLRALRKMERRGKKSEASNSPRSSSLMGEVWFRFGGRLTQRLFKPFYKIRNVMTAQTARVTALLQRRDLRMNALRANGDSVDVWWVPFVGADGIHLLKAPIVAHFFDFVSLEYPAGWSPDDINVLSLHHKFREGFARVERVIVTSKHALRDQLLPHFGVQESQVHIIPNPYPSYYRNILSSVAKAAAWPEIRQEAHGIIHHYLQTCLKEGSWPQKDIYTLTYLLPYYASLDWTKTDFLFAPTQDRPYKNLPRLIDLMEDLVRHEGMHDLKLVLTTALDMTSQNKLARMVYDRNLTRNVLCLPRLPDNVHAALYAAAQMSVHPSYFEGGIGTANFIEGPYLGCPALFAEGPHTREAAELFADGYADFMFLADRPDQMKKLVLEVMARRDYFVKKQGSIHAQIKNLDAEHTMAKYLEVFRLAASRGSKTVSAV